MTYTPSSLLRVTAAVTLLVLPTEVKSQTVQSGIGPIELQSGYPSDASVTKIYDTLDFQRACQAYIWAIPIVSINELHVGNQRDWGINFNDVGICDRYTTPAVAALTGNNTTIYGISFVDLTNGPVIIDSPQGAYGVIDDFWQRPIVEVGPFGPDRGKGGKFLLLPPDFKGESPTGYFTARSKTNKAIYLGRTFVKDGNIAAAVETLKKIRVYPFAQKDNPPETKVVLSGDRPMNSIAPRGFEYWERVASLINSEPVEARDRFFHAFLKPLGIEKGKPFNPDARQKKILTDAAEAGFFMAQTISMEPRFEGVSVYPGTRWEYALMLKPDQESENYSQLDERTDYTFEAITVAEGMIKKLVGAGSQYLSSAKDNTGAWLDGGRTYKLTIPANPPVKEFWAVTVYDNLTRSMIKTDTMQAGHSSHDKLQANADGSIDLWFGPEAPAGKESNWTRTLPGKGWFAYFRAYSPTEAFFDKTWKLPDIEQVK
ncbi:MAG: DUF1254 domain-containing protein [Verrucomicrobiota bacterium]